MVCTSCVAIKQGRAHLSWAFSSLSSSFNTNNAPFVQERLEHARADMLAACRAGLVHGILLAVRYMAASIPWASHAPALQAWMVQLLSLLTQTADVALPPLCHPKAGFSGGPHPSPLPSLHHQDKQPGGRG